MINMMKTRNANSNEAKISPPNDSEVNKVFLLKDEILNAKDETTTEIVPLRNPASSEISYYMFANNKIFEVIEYNEPYRSWFINQSVCSNGKFYLVTPIDPLFLILPYVMEECELHAIPLDQLLTKENEFEDTLRLLDVIQQSQFEFIGDLKKFQELTVLKYNEEKCLKWLERKCTKLVEILKVKKIHTGSGAVSSTFIKSEKLIDIDAKDIEYLQFAHGIISEYLPLKLAEKLQKHLGIPDETNPTIKRKSLAELDTKSKKKIKLEEITDCDDELPNIIVKKEKIVEKKVTAKTKALAKSASGTKSISSFFKKT